MTIALDGRALVGPHAGIGWHTYHLIAALARAAPSTRFAVFSHRPVDDPPETPANVEWIGGRAVSGLFWQQVSLARLVRSVGAELLHSTLGTLPVRLSVPAVVTLHDLTPRSLGGTHTWKSRIATGALLGRSLRHARRVISVSEHTKRDAVRTFQIPGEKIVVIYNGIGAEFRPVRDARALQKTRTAYAGGRPYFLFVGTLEPRKNLVRLVEAFAAFAARHAEPVLVLAGGRGWKDEPLWDAIRRFDLGRRVLRVGAVPPVALPALYSAATALLFPSLHEGFGLPAAEAMACGTPVLTSAVTALPEVVADAALLVDPHSTRSIEEGIERMWGDASLRRRLAVRGPIRARRFRWDAAARQTLRVYEAVLRGE